jgi:hypothetical protein
LKINRDNLKWAAKMALILLLAAVADGLVVEFVRKPIPWVEAISGSLPLLTAVFVILPMMRNEKGSQPNA